MSELKIKEIFALRLRRFTPVPIPPNVGVLAKVGEVINSDCWIGVEIEAEGWQGWLPKTEHIAAFWPAKAEGSLRNDGIEFVSPPMRGETISQALALLAILNDVHKLQYNDLTGLHIHLNMRECTTKQVANLMMIYTIFEDALFKFSGDRRQSVYCNPVRCSNSGIPDILALDIREAIQGANKYMACNYLPLKTFGTIEFRHSVGTNDIRYILNWINLLLRIWEFARVQRFDTLLDRVLKLNTNSQYQQLANEVFHDEVQLLSNSTLWNSMAEGVSIIKEWVIPSHKYVIFDTVVKPQGKPKPIKPAVNAIKHDLEVKWIPNGGFIVMDELVADHPRPIRMNKEDF